MGDLKTAYQLATERVIPSRYIRKDEDEDDTYKADFVTDWEYPSDDRNDGDYPVMLDYSDRAAGKDYHLPGGTVLRDLIPMEIIESEADGYFRQVSGQGGVLPSSPDVLSAAQMIQEDARINPSRREPMEVCWSGNFLDYGGFARLNRCMIFGLSDKNVIVNAEVQPYITDVNDSTRKSILEMSRNKISPKAPKIFGATIPTDPSHSGYKILFTMMETSLGVHKDYAEKLNMFNEVWVPTQNGKDILISGGVRARIEVMPLGVDVDRYKPSKECMDFGDTLKDFRFVSVFKWSYRKGYDILLKAYLDEFSNDDDVSLLLVSRNLSSMKDSGVSKMVDDFNVIKDSINKTPENLPHVSLFSEKVPEMDMPKIYNACDSFILISRGEGFGLPYCEAASCGLPVIASNCTGQTEFLDRNNSYLIDPDDYIESNITGSYTQMAKMSRFYEGQRFPVFGDKAIKLVGQAMRDVYEKRAEAKERAKRLRIKINKEYTWGQTIDRVYNRLQAIYKEQGL